MQRKGNWYKCLGVFVLMSLIACQQANTKKQKTGQERELHVKKLEHAQSFELSDAGDYKLLKVYRKRKKDESYEAFALVPEGGKAPEADIQSIPVPCKKIICLSSTQLTYFFALEDIDNIVATNSSRHLFHEGISKRIAEGKVKRVGKEGHFNIELIAGINPDVIFVSPYKAGGYDALKNLGIPLVPMAAYDEKTPLGRAEWVKMIAPFIGKEKEADSLFDNLAKRYNGLQKLASKVENRPTVFSGKMRSGTWYVPGGKSFYANYFRDAGADYIIDDEKQGAYPLDFESVYTKAAYCDFWRILVPEPAGFNRKALIDQDGRYSDFKAFKNKNVIMCNIREKPFYEQNAMKPDVILADYIHHFHPDLLPNYQPEFYEVLK
jgi:iron complex transport system substrate-binding protein